jgi:Tol biopolymer transport system component
MGEVYRATDSNLGREVAIKVLPPEVAEDPERLGRFKREAHLLAALNHPNIAAIYGLEEANGKPFLALELVEGEDLKARLARGAIPVDEALEIAEQVALALEEAHNKGIVHRDLKPANVKLTSDGKVKVLDFGLAKAWAGDASGVSSAPSALSQSPTLANTGTVAGVILGTAAYMSPEQARGRPVDRRADVWSFGVLLWEMLTGRSLFAGDTVTDVIAAVVTKEPDLDALPPATPRAVRRLLSRCLRKDPRARLPDIGAARLELQDVRAGVAADGEATGGVLAVGAGRGSRIRERAWAALAVTLAVVAAFLVWQRLGAGGDTRSPAHFVLDTPEDLTFWDYSPLALSPDGRHVSFVATSSDGTRRLWLRSMDSLEARALPGTEGALGAQIWSPDSASIAFAAGSELRKIALAGGTVLRVCALPENFNGGAWSRQGTIVFASGGQSALLYSVPEAGGEPTALTSHDTARGETGHYWPQFLPDGRHLLFVIVSSAPEHSGVHVITLDAPAERRRIRPEALRFQYVEPGYLLFAQNGILLSQRFDARALATKGDAVPIASSVAAWSVNSNWGTFSASSTGRVAWLSGRGSELQLEWVGRDGRRLGTLGKPARYGQISLSPDDKRVAAEISDTEGAFDLWLVDVARGVPSRLTTDPGDDRDPVWSPDSRALVYSSAARPSGDQDLLRVGLQGSEAAAPLPNGIGRTPGDRDIAKDWIREGDTLVYLTIGAERTLWAVSLGGGGKPEPLVKGFNVDRPRVSPDGRWLAFISAESGRYEVYVQPFRQRGERLRVSVDGGSQPQWRRDGKELFYLGLDGALMAVDVRAGTAGVDVGLPTRLVAGRDLRAAVEGPDYSDYAVSADGRRFLVKRPLEDASRQRIHVMLEWPSLVAK